MGLRRLETAEQKKSGGPPGSRGRVGAGRQAGPGRSITQEDCAEPGGRAKRKEPQIAQEASRAGEASLSATQLSARGEEGAGRLCLAGSGGEESLRRGSGRKGGPGRRPSPRRNQGPLRGAFQFSASRCGGAGPGEAIPGRILQEGWVALAGLLEGPPLVGCEH